MLRQFVSVRSTRLPRLRALASSATDGGRTTLDQHNSDKPEAGSSVKSTPRKGASSSNHKDDYDSKKQRGGLTPPRSNKNASSSAHAISHGTTFNVGQGAASGGGGGGGAAMLLQGTAFPFSSSPATSSWAHMPRNELKLEKMARQSLLHELWQEQQRTHEGAVDWFLRNMPASYFRQTTEESRLQHLGAISSMLEGGHVDTNGVERLTPTKDITLHFQRDVENMKEMTFVQSTKGRSDGILRLLDSLPQADGSLQRVHAFPSRDGNLAVYLFGYMKQDEVPHDAAGGHAAGVFFAEAIPQDTEA
ncbi:unnamed protein product, partial [Ectocarpus sp. 12 AP-2014]